MSDEQLIKEAQEKRLEELKLLQSAYKKFFDTADGQKIIKDLEVLCYTKDTTAIVDGTGKIDTNRMMINEGLRQAFLHILTMSSLDLDKLKEDRDGLS